MDKETQTDICPTGFTLSYVACTGYGLTAIAYGLTTELNLTPSGVTFRIVADLIGLCCLSKVILPETPLKVMPCHGVLHLGRCRRRRLS